ncbi:hypothetical protein [Nonomuraea sp. NPDC023979]|uniref:hypothetical protein n=1 Tax=Nonomuraea sp. NPDC023979 TaxID=3154796 RepID=UPI0033D4EC19
MHRRLAAAALLTLALAACGSTPAAQPEAAQPSSQDRQRQLQTVLADCMKQKGFEYVPYVPPAATVTDEERRRDSGDYEATKAHRAKYGFGVWSSIVYPNGPGTMPRDAGPSNPNDKIVSSLSETQTGAYYAALDPCYSKAAKQALGKDVKSKMDLFKQGAQTVKRNVAREIDGDPGLVDLAAAMGDCLKGKGYAVASAKPSALARRGPDRFQDEMTEIGREQQPGMAGSKNENAIIIPEMTADQARPHLDKEIKAALDDLECGKDFYAAYQPRKTEIDRRMLEEFALERS